MPETSSWWVKFSFEHLPLSLRQHIEKNYIILLQASEYNQLSQWCKLSIHGSSSAIQIVWNYVKYSQQRLLEIIPWYLYMICIWVRKTCWQNISLLCQMVMEVRGLHSLAMLDLSVTCKELPMGQCYRKMTYGT